MLICQSEVKTDLSAQMIASGVTANGRFWYNELGYLGLRSLFPNSVFRQTSVNSWRDTGAGAHIWNGKKERDGSQEEFQLSVMARATIKTGSYKICAE